MSDIDEAIETYLLAIEIEGRSPRTIASYANSLQDFRRVGRRLGHPAAVGEYTVAHVYEFLGALRERGAAPGYQYRRHREVKTCFSWLKRMDLIEENVFARVPLVRRPMVIRPPFSPEHITALLETLDRSRLTGCRNYGLLLLLLDTGVRASELIGINLEDVDWTERRVLIRQGKGAKERVVGIGERTSEALRTYVDAFRSQAPGRLFLTSKGEAMRGAGTLEVLLRRIGERAGVPKVYPHRFRHTFATWAIESGAREIDVQLLLGHSDLTMTQHYARTYTSEQAVRAHGELSPVRRLAG
jgi:site-specific recombinase XerD